MKKQSSSFLNRRATRREKTDSKRSARKPMSKKRRRQGVSKELKQSEIIEPPLTAAPAVEISEVIGSGVSATERVTTKKSREVAEPREPVFSPPSAPAFRSSDLSPAVVDRQMKRMAMWVAVSITMFIIVVIWAWSLRYSLVFQSSSSNSSSEFSAAAEGLTEIFGDVGNRIDQYKKFQEQQTADLNGKSKPSLTGEEIEALKQNLLKKTETNSEINN